MQASTFNGKKVLVTGHTGFKGVWLVQWLLQMGAEVCGISLEPNTEPSLFHLLEHKKKIKSYIQDIRDLQSLKKIISDFNPEVIMHLAAQALVRESYDDPKFTFDTNVSGTVNIFEVARALPNLKALLIVTSDKCYLNNNLGRDFVETDSLGGFDPYSASKAAADIVAQSYISSFFKNSTPAVAIARAGNVIGGGDWSKDRIMADCAKAWGRKEKVTIRNPNSTRPWQHVLDCIGGYLKLVDSLLTDPSSHHGQAYNFGPHSESKRTVLQLVNECKKHWDQSSIQISDHNSGSKVEAKLLSLDCTKAKEKLNWQSALGFDDTVAMTVKWYKDFYQNKSDPLSLTIENISQFQKLI